MTDKTLYVYPDPSKVPAVLQNQIKNYVKHGVPPGGFIKAVICNDLRGACMHGEAESVGAIAHIVAWFVNRAPALCWGSNVNYMTWCQMGDAQIAIILGKDWEADFG